MQQAVLWLSRWACGFQEWGDHLASVVQTDLLSMRIVRIAREIQGGEPQLVPHRPELQPCLSTL